MTEQATIYVALKRIKSASEQHPTIGNTYITYLENYVDGILPDEVRIVSATLWIDGPSLPNVKGNMLALIDPQKEYINRVGFPATQKYNPQYLKVVASRMIAPGTPNAVTNYWSPPITYRKGDALLIAHEYLDTISLDGTFLLLGIEYEGDLKNLPQPTTLLNVPFNSAAFNSPPTTARNLIPASPNLISKVRARVSLHETHPKASNAIISHVSVGTRSGTSSSTESTPVQLRFGVGDVEGIELHGRQWVWTDWTDFSAPAGKELLVSASMYLPGNSNNWSFNGSAGTGVWSASGDNWNTAALSGAVSFYANATAAVDMVQVQ